jgi:NAD-dependent deacetylase
MQSRCEACYQLDALSPDFSIPPHCSRCSSRARPNVVWFGENLPQTVFNRAIEAFAQAELAIVIGTSGVVEPAASLVRIAKQQDAYLIEVNPAETPLTFLADSFLQMTAVEAMELLEVS